MKKKIKLFEKIKNLNLKNIFFINKKKIKKFN